MCTLFLIYFLIDYIYPARNAVVKYAIFGLKRAKQLMANKEGTQEIFDYIQKVEDMRHCEDPVKAAVMAAENQFTLDHVPGHLLTSQDVCFILYYFSLVSLWFWEKVSHLASKCCLSLPGMSQIFKLLNVCSSQLTII